MSMGSIWCTVCFSSRSGKEKWHDFGSHALDLGGSVAKCNPKQYLLIDGIHIFLSASPIDLDDLYVIRDSHDFVAVLTVSETRCPGTMSRMWAECSPETFQIVALAPATLSKQSLGPLGQWSRSKQTVWQGFPIPLSISQTIRANASPSHFTALQMGGVGQAARIKSPSSWWIVLLLVQPHVQATLQCMWNIWPSLQSILLKKAWSLCMSAKPIWSSLQEDPLFSRMRIWKRMQCQHGVLLPVLLCTHWAHSCWQDCFQSAPGILPFAQVSSNPSPAWHDEGWT